MKDNLIKISHGGGGLIMHRLLNEEIIPVLSDRAQTVLEDAAVLDAPGAKLAFTTDSYVVNPLFFPGGDIGKLAICGTVNDLSMRGAKPLWISVGLIIEEGFSIADLRKILKSAKKAAEEAGVAIVAGDTKVVERGKADGLFINTSGVGVIREEPLISVAKAKPGDALIINGTIGDHGIAIVTYRETFPFKVSVESDCAPLSSLVETMLASGEVHALRDPTRGGLASALNEIADASKCSIEIWEESIPVRDEVRGICEVLGLDPLGVANEGKVLAAVKSEDAEEIVSKMRSQKYGSDSCVIGKVLEGPPGEVRLATSIGSRRILTMPSGEQLPRIC